MKFSIEKNKKTKVINIVIDGPDGKPLPFTLTEERAAAIVQILQTAMNSDSLKFAMELPE